MDGSFREGIVPRRSNEKPIVHIIMEPKPHPINKMEKYLCDSLKDVRNRQYQVEEHRTEKIF